MSGPSQPATWKEHLHEVIFEADTPAGKLFDIALLIAIGVSVTVVVLESVPSISATRGPALRAAEWGFTILFSIEYVLRLMSVRRPLRYATSFFGIVDLLAVMPTYMSLFVDGAQALLVIRALRLLRIFRVFRATAFAGEMNLLAHAVKASRAKITVFLLTVLTIVLILGAAIYAIEGPENGFESIPTGIYWAVVTITTVGYGDIAPQTVVGRFIAALAMVLGYSLIIIPTGIFSIELARSAQKATTQNCPDCTREGHDSDASYCKFCGGRL
jgi:voltage-gated potassium channel